MNDTRKPKATSPTTVHISTMVHQFFREQRKRTGITINFAINTVLEEYVTRMASGRSSGVEAERVVKGTAGGKKLRGKTAGK